MDVILKEIESEKELRMHRAKNISDREASYGLTDAVLKKHIGANPWLNRDVLNNYKRLKSKEEGGAISVHLVITKRNTDSVSMLTSTEDENKENDSLPNENIPKSKRGRPKGTTKKELFCSKRRKQMALNYAASEASTVKSSANSGGERVPKGTYNKIIKEAEEKFNLDEGAISKPTLLTRLRSNRKTVAAGRGHVSPLLAVEAHFVDIILQLSAMRQPLTASGALTVINSLVETSNMQGEIMKWKANNLPDEKDDEEGRTNQAYLGAAYWRNFKKRHPELKTKRAVRFDSKREDWCNYDNFKKMYDCVYAAMVNGRVAIQLEEEVMVRSDGTITSEEKEMVGRPTKFLLTRPEFVFFVDEVGCNTSQKSDGHNGGQKFLVKDTERALIRSSFADCHFTVLGFTNGRGDPVCCVIILACTELTAKCIMGVQPWADVVGDPMVDIEANSHGIDKFYPYGPTCVVGGKSVESYVTCSESGSITSDVLTNILKYLDQKLQFDRSEADPFLLLDGHGSRFELPFLDYIVDPTSKWTVCIGVPYGTNLWQVGDSSQQNGAYKMALTVEKQNLLEKKTKLCLDTKIERHDAVGLVHRAWLKSFAKRESNQRAIAERGWNPLNYNLLDHEELHKTRDNNPVKNANELSAINGIMVADPTTLNLSSDVARTMMDKIVDYKIREKALETARKGQEEDFIKKRQEIFDKCSKMTAGVAFNAGHLCLSDGTIHQKVREQYNMRQQKVLDAERKRKDDLAKLLSKVQKIREKSTDPHKWSASELQTMVSWFKRPGDSKIPQRKEQLLRRYELTCHRSEQERNRLKEGEQPVIDDDPPGNESNNVEVPPVSDDGNVAEGDVAEALLQIAVTEV